VCIRKRRKEFGLIFRSQIQFVGQAFGRRVSGEGKKWLNMFGHGAEHMKWKVKRK